MTPIRLEILTPSLRLRPFGPDDAPAVARLAGDPAVARDTFNIPHPYSNDEATAWIAAHPAQFRAGEALTLAVVLREGEELVGSMTLILDTDGASAELGYWIGRPHWGRGYATEAGRAMLELGFGALGLDRIHAHHFSRNAASGAVLRKLGMSHEGHAPRHVRKDDEQLDIDRYGLSAHRFLGSRAPAASGARVGDGAPGC